MREFAIYVSLSKVSNFDPIPSLLSRFYIWVLLCWKPIVPRSDAKISKSIFNSLVCNCAFSSSLQSSLQKEEMAATTALERPPDLRLDEDLTDEQIQALLARASARLKEKSISKDVAAVEKRQSYTFPKLETGKLEKAYVSTTGDVANVDARRMLEEKHRKQANGIRRVEEPVAAKKLAEEVRKKTFLTIRVPMRKTYPKLSLSRARAPFWSAFLPSERILFNHSYSETTTPSRFCL